MVPAIHDSAAFFGRDVETVARELIGITFLTNGVGGPIVETEAYDAKDPASHSFRGVTPRNAVMFGPPGHVYVYRIYGLHWCVNFTCGNGAGVLIRALEPLHGVKEMAARRRSTSTRLLCAGPGRLCEALAIDGSMSTLPLDQPPFRLIGTHERADVTVTTRIGLRVATDLARRFCKSGSLYLSRPPSASF